MFRIHLRLGSLPSLLLKFMVIGRFIEASTVGIIWAFFFKSLSLGPSNKIPLNMDQISPLVVKRRMICC